ncbi:MAG: DUF599 domain-containing protein [Alphaproteobacteria bacterium]
MNDFQTLIAEFSLGDWIGVAILAIGWPIYDFVADSRRVNIPDFTRAVVKFRHEWMLRAVRRDPRIADVQALGILIRNVGFFASTTIFILGGMVALIGASEAAYDLTRTMPFVAPSSLLFWQAKLMVVTLLFVYAFFELTWSLRQWNYCTIVLAAAPHTDDEAVLNDYGERAARLANLAGGRFTHAIRAYYYALALIAWFVQPWLFVAAVAMVLWVQYRRDFRSNTFRVLDAARTAPDARAPKGP